MKTRQLELISPELRLFPMTERQCALRQAGSALLEFVELAGIALRLAAAAALTRYRAARLAVAPISASTSASASASVAVAPAADPFPMRRTRRGVRPPIKRRSSPSQLARA